MSKTDPEPVYPTPEAAERAFYAAFANCDLPAMNKVWADEAVICIHPGSLPLVGREAVLMSWARILNSAAPLNLRVALISRRECSDLAVHVVEESISQHHAPAPSVVVATNVYLRKGDGWQLFEHHATTPGPQRSDVIGASLLPPHTLQ